MSFVLMAGWLVFGVCTTLTIWFVFTFAAEREPRAAIVSTGIAVPVLIALLVLLLMPVPGREWILSGFGTLLILGILVLAVPKTKSDVVRVSGEPKRVDERDAVFHRFYRLQPGTPEFEAYYADHPEKREFDEKVRAMPGLAGPGSKTYDPLSSPYQQACFQACDHVGREVEWEASPVGDGPVEASPEELARRIKGFARYLGALDAGCTALNPAWIYSHIGRSPGEWGAPVALDHTHAVAISVPMRHEMIRHAPDSPTTTETAFQYLEAARIAVVLARYISLLGYRSRAHVDGNYRVMCVPVAADAGLGELGRLGLLMTPKHGPRVRLAVVTTDMPLAQDEPVSFGVQDFCSFCKKCADVCPSASIDTGEQREYNGVVKWRSKQDSCYRAWRIVGSDCALCVKACPYAHPTSGAHDLVRWLISRNHLARKFALWADDLVYGRKPKATYPLPEWHRRTENADA